MKGLLGNKAYGRMRELMPIACADAIVEHGGKVLLVKRKDPPAKGAWWFVGGRIRKGETLENAVRRKVLEEAGLECRILGLVGVYDHFFREGRIHNISIVYAVRAKKGSIMLDETSSGYRLVSDAKGLHRYVRHAFRDWERLYGNRN